MDVVHVSVGIEAVAAVNSPEFAVTVPPKVALPDWELEPNTDNDEAVAEPSVEVVQVSVGIEAVLQVNAPDVIWTVAPNDAFALASNARAFDPL